MWLVLRTTALSSHSICFLSLLKSIDDEVPAFNEWNDSTERIIDVNGMYLDDVDNSEDAFIEEPPSLSESLEMVRRLRLLSNTQQPERQTFIVQLQSKLTDVFLDSNASKQRQIIDYFKPVSGVPGGDFRTVN